MCMVAVFCSTHGEVNMSNTAPPPQHLRPMSQIWLPGGCRRYSALSPASRHCRRPTRRLLYLTLPIKRPFLFALTGRIGSLKTLGNSTFYKITGAKSGILSFYRPFRSPKRSVFFLGNDHPDRSTRDDSVPDLYPISPISASRST